jgi:hypothetical protein
MLIHHKTGFREGREDLAPEYFQKETRLVGRIGDISTEPGRSRGIANE